MLEWIEYALPVRPADISGNGDEVDQSFLVMLTWTQLQATLVGGGNGLCAKCIEGVTERVPIL